MNAVLPRIGCQDVRQTAVDHDGIVSQMQPSARTEGPRALVPIDVDEILDDERRLTMQPLGRHQEGRPTGMRAQHQNHLSGMGKGIGNIKANPDKHGAPDE